MVTFFVGYLILTVIVVLVLVLIVNVARKKRLANPDAPPAGYEPTAEITVDPTTGRKQRVWYNARTGARYYETLLEDESRS